MKNCDDIQLLFSEFYDDTNNDEVTKHLETCIECKKEFEKYAQLIDEVRTLPIPEPPEDLHFKLMSGVQNKKVAMPLCGGLGAAPPLSDGNCESNFLANKKRLEQKRRKISLQRRFSFATTAVAACFLMAVIWFGGFFEARNIASVHDYVNFFPVASAPFSGFDEVVESIEDSSYITLEPESFFFGDEMLWGWNLDGSVSIAEAEDDLGLRRSHDVPYDVQMDTFDYILPIPSMSAPAPSIGSYGAGSFDGIEGIEATQVPEMESVLPHSQQDSFDFGIGSPVVGGGSAFVPNIPTPPPDIDTLRERGGDLLITHEEPELSALGSLFIADDIHYNQPVNTIWIIALVVSIILLLSGVIASIGFSIKLRNSQKSSTA